MSTWVLSSVIDAAAEAGQIQQRQGAHALLSEFFQQVPQGKSKNERDDYKGDRIALKSFALPAAKQLPAHVLDSNYFNHFLQHCARGDDDSKLEGFMASKLESQRFVQWADAVGAFQNGLMNIFSASLKPIDQSAFMRAIKRRFKVYRYEAHSQGPDGLFRPDVPQSMTLQRFDGPSEVGFKQGRFVFGSAVLVLVHQQLLHTEHAVFSVATGPFKHVEAWWQDMMQREALRVVARGGECPRMTNLDVAPSKPFASGARLIKAAMKPEVSELRVDVLDRSVDLSAAAQDKILDSELLEDTIEAPVSIDHSFDALED